MVALNFKIQFASDVARGAKRQTIRENTKAHPGCDLQLYTGQRTKSCRKLGDAVCISVVKLFMMKTLVQPSGNTAFAGKVHLDEFAKKDGFNTYEEMWAFFEPRANENGEFHGFLITW